MRARRLIGAVSLAVVVGLVAYVWIQRIAEPSLLAPPPLHPRQHSDADSRRGSSNGVPMGNLLLREVVRQGWLIAQREGLGLSTRDGVLREPALPDGAAAPDLAVTAYFKGDCELTAVPIPGAKSARPAWHMAIPSSDWGDGEVALMTTVEKLSRHEFVAALQSMGFKNASPATRAGAVPDLSAAERRLDELNFFSQFAALRQAHRSMREDGESQAALGVLVRGYANLGQLSRCLWNATGQAMGARAMVYAQRMVASAPPADVAARRAALWHRAYALAMAGLQSPAIDDLAAAAKLQPAEEKAAPDWVRQIDAYCHYKTSGLIELTGAATGEAVQLPAFLSYLTIEHTASPSALNQFGRAVLAGEPDNLRVLDAVAAVSGVAANHQLTLYALGSTCKSVTDRSLKLPGVPGTVTAAAHRASAADYAPRAVAALARALVDAGAGDAGEPSWAVLGRIVQDANFRNVERRIFFESRMWSVDASGSTRDLYPLAEDHPYGPLVKFIAARNAPPVELQQLMKGVKFVDVQLRMTRELYELQAAGINPEPEGPVSQWGFLVLYHMDTTTTDAEQLFVSAQRQHQDHAVEMLMESCPTHPAVVAHKIETQWSTVADHAEELSKESDGSPLIAGALGRKYSELRDWPHAEVYLRKYIEVCQDLWAYQRLADNYLAQGDEEHWLSTMRKFLEQEDYRLDHAQANVAIAKHFMDRREYEKAAPFADAAAESWAGWAMGVAAECQENLGHWEAAELWVKRQQERYGPATLWWDWCSRTHHGDIAAARRAADAADGAGGGKP